MSPLHNLLLAIIGFVVVVVGEGAFAFWCVGRQTERITREIRESAPPDAPRRRTLPARELVRR